MTKKILVILLCVALATVLCCCTVKKNGVNDDVAKQPQTQTEKEEPKEESKEDSKEEKTTEIELDVKQLSEVDEQILSQAAASLGFENAKLFHAFANAIGKNPEEITQADVDKVHYIAAGPEDNGGYSLFVGYIDYVDLCFSEAANEPDFMSKLNEVVMISELVYDIENDSLYDLGNFKNVEMFEIYNVNIDDVSFVKEYDTLALGYFKNNGITDVSSLKDYNPETLIELDFTGNKIENWTPLYHIKEKIIVHYELSGGFILTLDSYLEQTENPVEIPPAEEKTEQADVSESVSDYVIVDANGNPADFSSLFD